MSTDRSSELAELLARLVEIDSVNPTLVPGGPGESEIAVFVADWLRARGLDVDVSEAAPGRPNVVATARGRGGGRSLLLNAHTDTVGVAGMHAPFEPTVEAGRMYGRGAYDMKAGLAAAMVAAARARELELRGDVIVAAVADEEVASLGTQALVDSVHADAAIVCEPTELRVAVAHKGFVAWEIETEGRAAHGSRTDLGVDAIARMGRVLVRLGELAERLRTAGGHPLLGPGSVHASLIEGGQEFSSYPADCGLKGERRTIPGETVELVAEEVGALLDNVPGESRVLFSREPFEVAQRAEIVELVRRHAGGDGVIGVSFWADSGLLAGAGVPTVLFGPAGEGAHAEVEWVDLASVERCAEVYVSVATELCA